MQIVKPMRAVKVENSELSALKYPLFAQPKFDGIRCIVKDSMALSNTLKPIRNLKIQNYIGEWIPDGFDGELISGANFQDTSSCVMSEGGGNDFTYFVFDLWNSQLVYSKRQQQLADYFTNIQPDTRITLVQSVTIRNENQLLQYEASMLEEGHEGIMLRSPGGLYKFGRSTLRELYLVKRKPFLDDEAIIIGFEEQQENTNELTYDGRGYATRSAHQENKQAKGTLGCFLVRNVRWGEFRVGTGLGLTDSLRQEIWNSRDRYLHQQITFKYQAYGTKDKPRTPIFLRFRHEDDRMVEL
jgi:DNA ligase-1